MPRSPVSLSFRAIFLESDSTISVFSSILQLSPISMLSHGINYSSLIVEVYIYNCSDSKFWINKQVCFVGEKKGFVVEKKGLKNAKIISIQD